MRHRIGDRHRSRLLWFFAFLFAFLACGFARPRDPRVTAIVVPELGAETIEQAAHRALTRRDGIVLYVAVAEHRMRIETGPAARAIVGDEEARRILDDRMRPLLREGRVDDAVDAGVTAIEAALSASRSNTPTSTTRLSPAAWIGCGLGICGLLLLFAAAANASASRRTQRTRNAHVPVHVPYVDSGSSGFSGGGGASSSW